MFKYKKALIMASVFIFICIFVYIYTVYFSKPELLEDNNLKIELYFLDRLSNELKVEEKIISQNSTEEDMIKLLITDLQTTGPKIKSLTKALPENVKILEVKNFIGESTLEIEFSKEYLEMSPTEELLCRASFVWSLTSLPFIDNVHIYIEGEELLNVTSGQPIGLLNRNNVIINLDISPNKDDIQWITLYFANSDYSGLILEERAINIGNPNDKSIKSILEELIKGPRNKNLNSALPIDLKIRDVRIEDNEVCYIDLSQELITKHIGGPNNYKVAIYSIVNSICTSTSVKKVQILVESEKIKDFVSGVDLSSMLEKDQSIIISEQK